MVAFCCHHRQIVNLPFDIDLVSLPILFVMENIDGDILRRVVCYGCSTGDSCLLSCNQERCPFDICEVVMNNATGGRLKPNVAIRGANLQ